jgi:hypothetical protein
LNKSVWKLDLFDVRVVDQILYFTTQSSTTIVYSIITKLSLGRNNSVATILYFALGGNYRSLALFNGSLYIADDYNR